MIVQPSFRVSALRFLETCMWAAAGGAVFSFFGVPAGWLSGGLVLTAIAAFSGRQLTVLPSVMWVFSIAMGITIGGVVTPETLRGIAAWPVSIAVLVISGFCSTLCGFVYLRRVHGWDPVSASLAAMPGAMPQVLLYASQEKADVRGVAVVQTFRSAMFSVGLPAVLSQITTLDIVPGFGAATEGVGLAE
ncbi:MAG: AbrB family transcriptional regulator, partial [Pseudorhodoplanes sp.]